MHKTYYFIDNLGYPFGDELWTNRTIKEELKVCDIEISPNLIFLKYLNKKDKIIVGQSGFQKLVI